MATEAPVDVVLFEVGHPYKEGIILCVFEGKSQNCIVIGPTFRQ